VNIEATVPATPIVTGVEFVRKMRGGCQASLVRASDCRHYVVKANGNPHGPRVLVNNFLTHHLMALAGLATPQIALIKLPIPIGGADAKVHFASRFPGHPDVTTVFDLLPDSVLLTVENLSEFLGVLVLDQWLCNAGGRQAIFCRKPITAQGRNTERWVAQFIGNSQAFGGKAWTFRDLPMSGVYVRRGIYGSELSYKLVEPWVERVMGIDERAIAEAASMVPREWLQGDEQEFAHLMYRLSLRRKRLPELASECVNWILRDGRPISMKSRGPVAVTSITTTDLAAIAG
jgi:hypothetical protein